MVMELFLLISQVVLTHYPFGTKQSVQVLPKNQLLQYTLTLAQVSRIMQTEAQVEHGLANAIPLSMRPKELGHELIFLSNIKAIIILNIY